MLHRGKNRSKRLGLLAFETGWCHAARMSQFRNSSQTLRQTSLRFFGVAAGLQATARLSPRLGSNPSRSANLLLRSLSPASRTANHCPDFSKSSGIRFSIWNSVSTLR